MGETKEKGRNFTTVKKEKGDAFDSYCKKIAEQYAKSTSEFSYRYFTKEENIKRDCFYRILDRAVIKNLVDDETVNKMQEKARANQKIHCEDGIGSLVHYEELRSKRREYIISTISEETKLEIATYVGNNPEEELDEIAAKYSLNIIILKRILKEVFVNPKVDMNIPIRIELRTTRRATADEFEKIKKQFKELWHERERNRNKITRKKP